MYIKKYKPKTFVVNWDTLSAHSHHQK